MLHQERTAAFQPAQVHCFRGMIENLLPKPPFNRRFRRKTKLNFTGFVTVLELRAVNLQLTVKNRRLNALVLLWHAKQIDVSQNNTQEQFF